METIRIIYEVLLGLIVIYLAFFKSYFKEKGKNLATLEDIGQITKIIEQTKHDFDLKTETIKQQLQFLNQKKITFIQEERDSIIYFYEGYHKLLNQIMNVSSSFIDDLGSEEVLRLNRMIDTLQIEFDSASGRLELFFDSIELINAKKNLAISTIKLKELITFFLINLDSIIKRIKISENLPESPTKQEQWKNLIEEKLDCSVKFYKERVELYKPVNENLLIMRDLLRERLEKILNE